jgi:hypothetical protein
MKHFKVLFTIFALLLFANSFGQKSQKEINQEKNKVQIFSDEEDYYRLLLHYVYDIQRLDDKDKGNSDDEVKAGLEKIVSTMNSKIQPVLSEKQYQQHLYNFNDILKSIYRRNSWEWTKN